LCDERDEIMLKVKHSSILIVSFDFAFIKVTLTAATFY
jgi:hypothetical protein